MIIGAGVDGRGHACTRDQQYRAGLMLARAVDFESCKCIMKAYFVMHSSLMNRCTYICTAQFNLTE